MMHIKACYEKSIIKYAIILVLLFTTLLLFSHINKSIGIALNEQKNREEYRLVIVILKENDNIDNITNGNSDLIEKVEYNTDDEVYEIVLNKTEDVTTFISNISPLVASISTSPYTDDNQLLIASNIFKIIIIICSIIMLILIFIFSINVIFNLEKDIALYKLIGYSKKKIILYLLLYLSIYYLLLYIIGVIIFILVLLVIPNNITSLPLVDLNNGLLVKDYFILLGIITIVIALSFIRVIKKINKISPINLIKE